MSVRDEKKRDRRWAKAVEEAERRFFKPVPVERLADMSSSPDSAIRRLAVALMVKQLKAGTPLEEYIPILRTLVADEDHLCRWQSQIALSEVIFSGDPEIAWEIVVEHADSEDDDLRAAIACLLLEDLLDQYFDEYFPRVCKMARNASPGTLEMIRTCWFDNFGPRYHRLQNIVAKQERGRPRPTRK